MSAIIVNGSTPFGALSNAAIAKLIEAAAELHRCKLASAAAQSGAPDPIGAALETNSNFGVVPSTTPGEQGAAYAYALDVLIKRCKRSLLPIRGRSPPWIMGSHNG